jgi:hypothetical protein
MGVKGFIKKMSSALLGLSISAELRGVVDTGA